MLLLFSLAVSAMQIALIVSHDLTVPRRVRPAGGDVPRNLVSIPTEAAAA